MRGDILKLRLFWLNFLIFEQISEGHLPTGINEAFAFLTEDLALEPVQLLFEALDLGFQDSGLSRQKFCASRGISLPRLTRWMAFFRRESPSPTLSPFVDLGAVNQSASVSGPHVELVLDLGDGIVMTLRRAS